MMFQLSYVNFIGFEQVASFTNFASVTYANSLESRFLLWNLLTVRFENYQMELTGAINSSENF